MRKFRIAIDIGGTFTDFVVEGEREHHAFKLLTTPSEPQQAVLAGIDRILADYQIAPSEISAIAHGTTLATNAVIERRGAKVGFVTTRGFRDTLEMGYEYRYDQYNLLIDRTPPLVERALRFVVPERIVAGGKVFRPLDEDAVRKVAAELATAGVEAVAIGFLHSFANPAHEQAAEEIVRQFLPGVPISLSSDVAPEIREYDRFSTVVVNAYIRPLVQTYLAAMEAGLRSRGIAAPVLLIQSNGGLCDIATASRYPVRLLESGPAGGALFAAAIARDLEINRALLLDVGGTTVKLCFVDDARPHTARGMEVARADRYYAGSGIPLRFPVIELSEIGGGGGSIVQVDALGRLRVGPRSAGSAPGPVCYGRGGEAPTVTDANLLLGRLDPARFAGGSIPLQTKPAHDAMRAAIAAPLGLTIEDSCCGVLAILNENMANAAREHALDADKSLPGRTLIAIGGGSGLHAPDLAISLGIDSVIIPSDAGVGSAAGFLCAPFAFERSLSAPQRLDDYRHDDLLPRIDGLIARTIADLRNTGLVSDDDITTSLSAQMRYSGQGSELTIPINYDDLHQSDAPHRIAAVFLKAYRSQYGRAMGGNPIEILGWTVRSEAAASPRQPNEQAVKGGEPAVPHRRRLVDAATGTPVDAAMYQRHELSLGTAISGPALVIDTGTIIIVPAGWSATVARGGHLHLRRQRAAENEIAA
jgi:N-methylhydantoinase A/oxoprolinase/acetone carboxylase beta subunit